MIEHKDFDRLLRRLRDATRIFGSESALALACIRGGAVHEVMAILDRKNNPLMSEMSEEMGGGCFKGPLEAEVG